MVTINPDKTRKLMLLFANIVGGGIFCYTKKARKAMDSEKRSLSAFFCIGYSFHMVRSKYDRIIHDEIYGG